MSEITLYDYMAANVPHECIEVLESHGYEASNNVNDLADDLKLFVREHRHEAMQELAEIHPDSELILEMVEFATPYQGEAESEYLNATGTLDRISNIEHTLMSSGSSAPMQTTNEMGLSKSDFILGIGAVIVTSLILHKKD